MRTKSGQDSGLPTVAGALLLNRRKESFAFHSLKNQVFFLGRLFFLIRTKILPRKRKSLFLVFSPSIPSRQLMCDWHGPSSHRETTKMHWKISDVQASGEWFRWLWCKTKGILNFFLGSLIISFLRTGLLPEWQKKVTFAFTFSGLQAVVLV